jgi:hypothetical protein
MAPKIKTATPIPGVALAGARATGIADHGAAASKEQQTGMANPTQKAKEQTMNLQKPNKTINANAAD